MHCGGSSPEWLVRAAPSARRLVCEAAQHENRAIRLSAVRACRFLIDEEIKQGLRTMALRDPALVVREAASIELAEWIGACVVDLLCEGGNEEEQFRTASSLAFIRDRDRSLVALPLKSIRFSCLVVSALIWHRLRRDAQKIFRGCVGGTLGGAVSGLLGSFFLGIALTAARHEVINEAASLIFVLTSLGCLIGALGGLGVSLGLVAGASLSVRRGKLWAVLAGAGGGALIGGGAKLLGVDALKALFGQNPSGVTGSFEGAILGTGLALGAVLIGRETPDARDWRSALGMAAGGMVAGAFLAMIGGNLFSGSLEVVARSFADSRIRMDPIAGFFGETQFGRTTQVVLGAVEGFVFGTGVGAGLRLTAKRRVVAVGLPPRQGRADLR